MNIEEFFMTKTFKDRTGRTIHYDYSDKTALRVPKEIESMYKLFQGRGLYAVIAFLLLYINKVPEMITIIIPIGVYAAASVYFNTTLVAKFNPT